MSAAIVRCACPGPHRTEFSPLPPGPCIGPAAYVVADGTPRCTRCVYSGQYKRLPDLLEMKAEEFIKWDALGFLLLLTELASEEKP